MVSTRTCILPTSEGGIEYLLVGRDEPVTVFAHGLAGSISTTRPFGSGVPGRQVYFHFRGHGASSSPESAWTYTALADELDAVATHVGATRALGVSMGAGAIAHLLERVPDRFERIVLALPAVLDTPRTDIALERLLEMGRLADEHDVDGVFELLLLEQPGEHRDDPVVRNWCMAQAHTIVRTDVSRALRTIPHATAVHDRRSLQAVQAQVLVLGQEDDPAHPLWVSREIADLIPNARLEVLPPGGILWSHRARVRELVRDFLA